MSVEHTNISGDESIGRDLTVGGKATVRNNADFARNVTVRGWLDAPNVKHAFKGLYSSAESLAAAYPQPQSGWYALVADYASVPNDDGTYQKLEDIAVVYAAVDGSWVATQLSSAQLTAYVETIENQLSTLSDELSEELDDYVRFSDVVVFDGDNKKNGVMSIGMGYELSRLHKASSHISHFLDGEHSILDSYLDSPRSIYYLSDMHTFAASAVDDKEDNPTLYKTWGENTSAGFHESSVYQNDSGVPYGKLFFCGVVAYIYDRSREEMTVLGDMSSYVAVDRYGSTSERGIVGVTAGNGLSVSDGVIAMSAASASAAGALSSSDKSKLDALSTSAVVQGVDASGSSPLTLTGSVSGGVLTLRGSVAAATSSSAGVMSAADKAAIDNFVLFLPQFTGIIDGTIAGALNETLSEVYGVWYVVGNDQWVAQSSNGYYYTQWTSSNGYASSDYYVCAGDRAYVSGGTLYRYDTNKCTLVLFGDMSMYVTVNDIATAESDGLLSKDDKSKLDFLYAAIDGGRISHGTMRFTNYCCTKKMNGTLNTTDSIDEWDGIMWLKDAKMFVAYKGVAVLSDCGCASVTFTFYTHWSAAHLYMEHIATAEGLWKDKAYIYNGGVYVWKSCEHQLVLSAGSFVAISDADIDEALSDFEFVSPGNITGIASIDVQAASPLSATVAVQDNEALVRLSIAEATEDQVDTIFE